MEKPKQQKQMELELKTGEEIKKGEEITEDYDELNIIKQSDDAKK